MPVSTSPGKPIAGYDLENSVLLNAVADITRGRSATILDVGCDTGRLAATPRRDPGLSHVRRIDVAGAAIAIGVLVLVAANLFYAWRLLWPYVLNA